jgi:CRP/FNR family transcriptional regulator, cyclic AMP receptor protein
MMIDTDILLAWGATYKKLAAGETIFREGTEGHFYYQLESGSVRWVNITDEGKEFIQNMVEPGECFGEFPLFDDYPYAASAIANKDSVILRLHKATFHQLLKEHPEIHFKFSRTLTERLRFKFMFIQELANSDPEHTILTLFNYFKESKRNICLNCNKVQLTRQQIADMTGLRVETVIRAIRSLQEKGTLTIDKGKVYC